MDANIETCGDVLAGDAGHEMHGLKEMNGLAVDVGEEISPFPSNGHQMDSTRMYCA